MVFYDLLAVIVDVLHILLIIVWVGGWFVSKDRHPTFRRVHSYFGIVIVPLQVLFSMRCPMVLLSGYLRELAHPNKDMSWYLEPFIVRTLRATFGFTVSDMCVTMTILMGAVVAVWTILTIKGKNNT